MKYNTDQIIKRYHTAQNIKYSWDNKYKEVFEYCIPARDGYQKAMAGEQIDPSFQDRREHLYSSIGEQSASEFVNTMQEVLCPPQQSWIDLEAGYLFPEDEREDVNTELAKLCTLANEFKNISNFDTAFSEFCYDAFAGTACMSVLPGDTEYDPIIFRAIPLREYCIEEGANGDVRWVFRRYELKKELVKEQWRELKNMEVTADDACKEMFIIECTYYDASIGRWIYKVIDEKSKEELLSREYETSPFIVLRWNKCAGEPYGRGVGITALNDLKTLNLIKEFGLRSLAYNLPPLMVQEDAMLDVDGLEMTPLSLNVVPNTQTSIVPLAITPTNPNIEQYKVQELQMDIKRNTFGNTLPNEGNKQLTATEVNYRRMELQRALNSVFGRLIGEFQLPLVRRIFDILKETKRIKRDFSVLDINGLIYKVKVNTPISRALQVNEAQAIMGGVQYLIQLDPTGETLYKLLKVNKLGIHLLATMGLSSEYINTLKEVEQAEMEQVQAQQAMQQQQAQMQVQTKNAEAMGKAEAEIIKEGARG
jgi:hypothetical protein